MALPRRDFKIQTEINPNFKIASIIGFSDLRCQVVYAGAPNQSENIFAAKLFIIFKALKCF